MPRPPWTWEYEDDLLPHITARRVHPSCVCFLDLEVRSTTFFPNACAIHSTEEAHIYFSLPGAIGMYALSLGVQRVNEILPEPVYALLSGLNASTVGIIALAAVQLAEKAIKDKLTRIQVILGACAGLCYNSLWYFPALMVIGGLATVIWDGWMAQQIGKMKAKWRKRRENPQAEAEESVQGGDSIPLEERSEGAQSGVQR